MGSLNDHYWNQMLNRSHRRIVPPCMDDLRRIACHDPAVRTFLSAWEAGGFPSLESCLIGIVAHLHETNERLMRGAIERAQHGPSPFSVMQELFCRMKAARETSDTPTIVTATDKPPCPPGGGH